MRFTLLCLLLSGCAHTVLYEGGQKVLMTQADATGLRVRTANGTTLEAASLTHSVPTLAGGQAVSQGIGAVSGLAGTIMTGAVALKAVPVAPVAAVVAPAATTSVQKIPEASTAVETRRMMEERRGYVPRGWDK